MLGGEHGGVNGGWILVPRAGSAVAARWDASSCPTGQKLNVKV